MCAKIHKKLFHKKSWDIVFIFRFSISNIFVTIKLQYIHDSKPNENVAVREGMVKFFYSRKQAQVYEKYVANVYDVSRSE